MLIHKNKKLRKMKVNPFLAVAIGLLMVAGGYVVWRSIERAPEQTSVEQVPGEFPKKVTVEPVVADEPPTPEPEPALEPQEAGYPVQLSMEEAGSLSVVVNKKHKLPSDYVPNLTSVRGASLRPEAASALESLLSDAEATGLGVKVISSYRSYATQINTYNGYVNQYGQEYADTISARPGHSEHQTGLAVDVGGGGCDLEICFGTTPFGEWLKSNAYKYGYIIRYPSGKEAETGYQYEPWHLRYVGISAAQSISASGQTMDQFYGFVAGSY
jgi:D-alanyl-D-alanine carboxypeptidase